MALGKSKQELGELGERLAEKFLRRLGCKILRRNWVSRAGEIDLIARDGDEVVFVEVKCRSAAPGADPPEIVQPGQIKSICLSAREFADRYRLHDHPLRFDVVTVIFADDGEPEIKHYKDAFSSPRGR